MPSLTTNESGLRLRYWTANPVHGCKAAEHVLAMTGLRKDILYSLALAHEIAGKTSKELRIVLQRAYLGVSDTGHRSASRIDSLVRCVYSIFFCAFDPTP